MSSDVKDDVNSKNAPLIMESSRGLSNQNPQVDDFLQEWYVRTVTDEPFKPGGVIADSASRYKLQGAGAGIGAGSSAVAFTQTQ